MCSDSQNPLEKIISLIESTKRRLRKLSQDRQWDVLLIVATVFTWIIFNPVDGQFIGVLFKEDIPDLYYTLFNAIIFVEITLAILFVFFEEKITKILWGGVVDDAQDGGLDDAQDGGLDDAQDGGLDVPEKNLKRNNFIYFTILGFTLAILSTTLFDFFRSPPLLSDYLECADTSGDCFSTGENILIRRSAFDLQQRAVPQDRQISQDTDATIIELVSSPWKEKCQEQWTLKTTATALYSGRNFIKSKEKFDEFLDVCPSDPEARIYSENSKLLQDLKNKRDIRNIENITAVVPASIENGHVESQEILRGIVIAQKKFNNIDNRNIKVLVSIADDGYKEENIERRNKAENERLAANNVADFLTYERKDTIGVIGHFSSDASDEAANCYQGQMVAISPTSTAVRINVAKTSEEDLEVESVDKQLLEKSICTADNSQVLEDKNLIFDPGNYILRTALNDKVVIQNLAESEEDIPYKYLAIVYESDSVYSQSFKDGLRELWPSNRILNSDDNEFCDFTQDRNFDSEDCLKDIHKKIAASSEITPDEVALVLVPSSKNTKEISDILEENASETYGGRLGLIGADSMYDPAFLSPSTEGMILFVSLPKDDSQREYIELQEKVAEILPMTSQISDRVEMSWRTYTSYTAATLLFEAADGAHEKCNPVQRIARRQYNPIDKLNHSECMREFIHRELVPSDNVSLSPSSTVFNKYGDLDSQPAGDIGAFVNVHCLSESSCHFSRRKTL